MRLLKVHGFNETKIPYKPVRKLNIYRHNWKESKKKADEDTVPCKNC